jgi:hypothetical protein
MAQPPKKPRRAGLDERDAEPARGRGPTSGRPRPRASTISAAPAATLKAPPTVPPPADRGRRSDDRPPARDILRQAARGRAEAAAARDRRSKEDTNQPASVVSALTAERDALRVEVKVARRRIAELEAARETALARVESVLAALRLLQDRI